jgi:hypothetical protein
LSQVRGHGRIWLDRYDASASLDQPAGHLPGSWAALKDHRSRSKSTARLQDFVDALWVFWTASVISRNIEPVDAARFGA